MRALGCFDSDDDGFDECWPIASGAGAIGDPCEALGDCGGSREGLCAIDNGAGRPRFFGDGYCTAACTPGSCPAGSHCGFLGDGGEGLCLADCAGPRDCRSDGYGWFDADGGGPAECWPSATGTGSVGDPCFEDRECAGGRLGACIEPTAEWIGGYCLQGCDAERPCPAGAVCSIIDEGDGGTCFDGCAGPAECRDGYTCATFDGDVLGCVPTSFTT